MRPAAHIEPLPLAVNRNRFAFRNGLDDFHLVVLTDFGKDPDRLIPAPDLAPDGKIPLHDHMHAILDLLQVFGRERFVTREIIVKAILDRRTDGNLGTRVEFLHGLRHDMGGIVPHQFESLVIAGGDNGKLRIVLDQATAVNDRAIELARKSGPGKTGTDGCGNLLHGDGAVELTSTAVRKRNGGHDARLQW